MTNEEVLAQDIRELSLTHTVARMALTRFLEKARAEEKALRDAVEKAASGIEQFVSYHQWAADESRGATLFAGWQDPVAEDETGEQK